MSIDVQIMLYPVHGLQEFHNVDTNFIKLFRLAQLMLEYLLVCHIKDPWSCKYTYVYTFIVYVAFSTISVRPLHSA